MTDHTEAYMVPRDVWLGDIKKRWGWVLALGILFTVLGLIGLGMIFAVTIASVLLFGILLIGGSIAHVIQLFRVHGWRNMGIQTLIAVLYLVTAVLIFTDPVAASISLTLVLAIFLFGVGILRIIGGIDARPLSGWGWVLTGGIIDVLLGIIVLSGWPVAGLWVIGLFISIDLLVSGIAYIILAFQLHRGALEA